MLYGRAIFVWCRQNSAMVSTKLQNLKTVSLREKAEATRRIENFKEYFRHLSVKGIPAPAPSIFYFLTDAYLRKFAEGWVDGEPGTASPFCLPSAVLTAD